MSSAPLPFRGSRTLAIGVVDALADRIRDGRFAPGSKLPTEAEIVQEFGVSRTVVREAISKLQASGFVETRHGIGTFVVGFGDSPAFRIAPQHMATMRDVIAVLELRIGIETEAAALAAQRRSEADLRAMRAVVDQLAAAVEAGRDDIGPDYQFHLEIARATQNAHYAQLMASFGPLVIPRARPGSVRGLSEDRRDDLRRVCTEHESVCDAIAEQDADAARAAMRTHLANSRERRRRAHAQASRSGKL